MWNKTGTEIHPSIILKAGFVKRWNVLPLRKEQNVAEHSHNVAMFAIQIVDRVFNLDRQWVDMFNADLGWSSHNDVKLAVLRHALEHDLGEALTGDPVSPTKKAMTDNGFFDHIDEMIGVNVLDPENIVAQIVKVADLLADLLYVTHWTEVCSTPAGMHVQQVQGELFQSLVDRHSDAEFESGRAEEGGNPALAEYYDFISHCVHRAMDIADEYASKGHPYLDSDGRVDIHEGAIE